MFAEGGKRKKKKTGTETIFTYKLVEHFKTDFKHQIN